MASSDRRRAEAHTALADVRYAPLFTAVRRRLERNGASLAGTALRLGTLSAEERDAICGLLGRATREGTAVRVTLEELDQILRRGAAEVGLVDLVTAQSGPLTDRPAERSRSRAERERMWAEAAAHPAVARHPGLVDWLAGLQRSGAATRLARSAGVDPDALLHSTLGVASRLPAEATVLARLATDTTGDAHALDRGRPLGTLVDGALDHLDVSRHDDDRPLADDGDSARAWLWRRRWARVGVLCDDLSVSVLVLNLPVDPSSELVAGTVSNHRAFGEPLRLTLRQLALAELTVPAGTLINVCENPSVVAQAASLLETNAAPVVCVGGNPDSAAVALLDLLVASGARLRYHGDFDWGGIRIANRVVADWAAEPWRMGAGDYRSAAPEGRLALTGAPVEASWDVRLSAAMVEAGVAVHEEQVLDVLLADLAG